jgi:hypothetical protein
MWSRKKRNCLSPKVWTIKREIYRAFALRNLELSKARAFPNVQNYFEEQKFAKTKKGTCRALLFCPKNLAYFFCSSCPRKTLPTERTQDHKDFHRFSFDSSFGQYLNHSSAFRSRCRMEPDHFCGIRSLRRCSCGSDGSSPNSDVQHGLILKVAKSETFYSF